jgi:hypothetical protein
MLIIPPQILTSILRKEISCTIKVETFQNFPSIITVAELLKDAWRGGKNFVENVCRKEAINKFPL